MTRAEALKKAHLNDKRINSSLEQLERFIAIAEKSTQILSGMPRGGDGGTSKLEDNVIRILELREQIADDLEQEAMIYMMNRDTIASIRDNLGRTIFELRYMNYMTWQEIADEIGYDRGYVEKIHKKIMEEIEADEKTVQKEL